jgi:hypothetical protein
VRIVRIVATVFIAWLFSACGGGTEEGAIKPPSLDMPSTSFATQTIAPAGTPATGRIEFPRDLVFTKIVPKSATPKPLAPAQAEDPQLYVEDESGVTRRYFELEPVHGRGYPELKVVVKARRIGDPAPHEVVRPYCRTQDSCEFGLSDKLVVTVSNLSLVQLVARSDGIAVISKSLGVEKETVVDLVVFRGEKVFSARRIALLPAS